MSITMAAIMMVSVARTQRKGRAKGNVRQRGNSFQVNVYAGIDPLSGKRIYLTESTTDEREAEKILRRLQSEVDAKRGAKTKGTLSTAVQEWPPKHDVEKSTRNSYQLYFDRFVLPALGDEPVVKIDPKQLEDLYAELRRCRVRCDGTPFVEHRLDGRHECRVVKHKRPPGRPPASGYPEHDCDKTGCKVVECPPHRCNPLGASTISKIHFVLSTLFDACVRWEWINSDPADVARKPRQPAPDPQPPPADQASRIVNAAWSEGNDWGTLVWLVMVTGLRRAELLALRWHDVELDAGYLNVRRNYLRVDGETIEKDTKTHRMRRLALDPATVELLNEHRERHQAIMQELDSKLPDHAFLFSTRGRTRSPV